MELTQELLRKHFDYRNGVLYWKIATSVRRMAGMSAGGLTSHGYVVIALNGRSTYAHRAIWVYHNGPIPKGYVIDHIDGDSRNNILENLRAVPQALNMQNQKPTARSKSGYVGVRHIKSSGSWAAQIKVGGKMLSLGQFREQLHALIARRSAEKALGFLTHLHTTT